MTDLIEIEGGEVLANLDERTITGLLVPFNEIGRTNVGQFQVDAGAIRIPADPTVVGLNTDHDRYAPVGRAERVWEEPRGIMATFRIAQTPEGDAALQDAHSGKRKCLSGEFRTGIRGGRATGGNLAGAALVERGAFASAMVLAADTPDEDEENTPESPDAEDNEEEKEGTDVPDTQTDDVQAQLPAPPALTEPRLDTQEVLAAIATYRKNPFDQNSREVLAALSDITISGAGALPASGVLQQTWLSRIDIGEEYVREYIGLCKLGTQITAAGKKGFKFKRGTSGSPTWSDGTWAGNKTEINSGVGHTTTHESTLERYARGADIGREFFDLPGGSEVIAAFLAELKSDYMQWSDEKALALIVSTAGAPVAPAAYPGVDGHDYAGAIGQLIQGILAVKRRKADGRRDTPSFAIANTLAYEELIYTPKDLLPEFVSVSVGLDGTATVEGRNGRVVVVEGDTGVEDTSSVIVGADYAIEFDELPGGPLHVNALEIAKGGVDEAVHGYLQKFVRRPEAVVHIGTADV